MKTRTLITLTLTLALMVPAGAALAADRTDESATDEVSTPVVSKMVLQLERMKDPRTQQRLYYRVHEVAKLAGQSEKVVLAAIDEGKLCVIRVDGVPLVLANFAKGYVENAAMASTADEDELKLGAR